MCEVKQDECLSIQNQTQPDVPLAVTLTRADGGAFDAPSAIHSGQEFYQCAAGNDSARPAEITQILIRVAHGCPLTLPFLPWFWTKPADPDGTIKSSSITIVVSNANVAVYTQSLFPKQSPNAPLQSAPMAHPRVTATALAPRLAKPIPTAAGYDVHQVALHAQMLGVDVSTFAYVRAPRGGMGHM